MMLIPTARKQVHTSTPVVFDHRTFQILRGRSAQGFRDTI
ncbi:MAG TPA: hypothetical protein TECP_00046 [Hyphomicrobiaceae bacterium MAG_BT-2024]